jgi:hypothetical protein
MSNSIDEERTTFLNVDLDIISKSRLEPLVAAFGKKVSVLYVGPERSLYGAHLELGGPRFPKSADMAIRALAALVRQLPRKVRRLWNHARVKDFNIGIQGGYRPHCSVFPLNVETINAVARLGARVVVTVYSPLEVSKTEVRPEDANRGVQAAQQRVSTASRRRPKRSAARS